MGASVAYVWRQKTQTTTQKIIQGTSLSPSLPPASLSADADDLSSLLYFLRSARMIAQAAALILLFSAAYFSATHAVEGETKVRRTILPISSFLSVQSSPSIRWVLLGPYL
jgi:hypothetical protein